MQGVLPSGSVWADKPPAGVPACYTSTQALPTPGSIADLGVEPIGGSRVSRPPHGGGQQKSCRGCQKARLVRIMFSRIAPPANHLPHEVNRALTHVRYGNLGFIVRDDLVCAPTDAAALLGSGLSTWYDCLRLPTSEPEWTSSWKERTERESCAEIQVYRRQECAPAETRILPVVSLSKAGVSEGCGLA